jgi:integrase
MMISVVSYCGNYCAILEKPMAKIAEGSLPKYCLHRNSGQAYVSLGGKSIYLGKYGTEESRVKYNETVGRWVANGRKIQEVVSGSPTIGFVLDKYFDHATIYYRKRGRSTSEIRHIRTVSSRFRRLYGSEIASEYTPSRHKTLRQSWVQSGLSRVTVNRYARTVLRILSWAVENEYLDGTVVHSIREVAPLPKGRSEARETDPIGPAPEESFRAIVESGHRILADLIRVQLYTGARPGEVCEMRLQEIDRSGEIWIYRPTSHKTEHRGKSREIAIGPRSQEILAARVARCRKDTDYLFHPRSNPGSPYRERSYHETLRYQCLKLGVPHFHPNQIRHSALTAIRRRFGLEGGRVVGGHSDAMTTSVYAQFDDLAEARKIASEMG